MSTERDMTRTVRSWLRTDEHVSADRILDVVLDQLDTTPQRRSLLSAWRFPLMNNAARLTVAAAAVVVVLFVGYQFVSGPNTGGPGPSPTPSPEPTATPVPSPTPVAAPFPPAGVVAIGRHPMILSGVKLSIELSTAGWVSNGQWGIDRGGLDGPDSAGFIFWPDSAPDNVFADPCAETLLSPPPGSSAAELAAAVAGIPGLNLVSGPSEVTIGGYPAQHVVITVPETIGCAPDHFYLWEDLDTRGAARYATSVGETFRIWIIDTGGALLWIDSETFAQSSAATAQEVQDIVNSIRFE